MCINIYIMCVYVYMNQCEPHRLLFKSFCMIVFMGVKCWYTCFSPIYKYSFIHFLTIRKTERTFHMVDIGFFPLALSTLLDKIFL